MRGDAARTIVRWGHGISAMSLLLFLSVPLAAAPRTLDVQASLGFGGWVVPGRWTPLRVTLTAAQPVQGTLIVEVPGTARTDPAVRHTYPVRLPPGTTQQVTMDVVVRDPRRPLIVRVTPDAERPVEIPVGAARAVDGVVAAVTGEQAGLEFLQTGRRRLRPAYLDERDLPSRWQSYDGVALLVIRDLRSRAVSADQQRALTDWVVQGGRLLITVHEGLDLTAPWLHDLLPVEPPSTLLQPLRTSGIPVPVVPLVAKPAATVRALDGGPQAVSARYGRGIVEVWAFDAFSPTARAWPGRVRMWEALLDQPPDPPLAQDDLAEQLPQTRPLPGTTQAALAALFVLYIVGIRIVLRRLSRLRGGWVAAAMAVVAFGVLLHTFAAGARGESTTLFQVSLIEALPESRAARVDTYASLVAPYGGRFRIVTAPDAAVTLLGPAALTVDELRREIAGGTTGQITFRAAQVTALDVRAAAQDGAGVLRVTVDARKGPRLRGALLYRQRQVYRLPAGSDATPVQVDPAGWTAVDRSGVFDAGTDGRALQWLVARLDRTTQADLWLLAFLDDDRLGLRLAGGETAPPVQLLVMALWVR